jgi:hypothetical protein
VLLPKGKLVIKSEDKPRALIIADKEVGLDPVTNLCTRDAAVGLFKSGGKSTVLASIYLDITSNVVSDDLLNILEYADRRKFALLLGVDFSPTLLLIIT